MSCRPPSSLQSRAFGLLPTDAGVEAWTLTGKGGLTLETITYGGIVTRLLAPDRHGKVADVVLGFRELGPYLTDRAYFGAIVGRVAGRISAAKFQLDAKLYTLAINDPPNHLHGGPHGFSRCLWLAKPVNRPDGSPSLRLTRQSPDGEAGYPGKVDVSVTYTVTNDNAFLIETEASCNQPTPFALTHHSYFNLAGESSGSVADHELQIQANDFVPTDEWMTLSGRVEPVLAGVNDFRCSRRLGDAIPALYRNHGDLYRLRERGEQGLGSPLAISARLVHPQSGRVLEVQTTTPYMQLYTAAALDGSITGKSGIAYQRHAAVCLECQEYADGANTPALGDMILRPGQPRRQTTAYAFSCMPASETSFIGAAKDP